MVQMVNRKEGIGWGNKTLSELLEEDRTVLSRYRILLWIERTAAFSADPMKLELFHSRLLSAAIAGRETTRMVSASPQVREVAELAVALIYT